MKLIIDIPEEIYESQRYVQYFGAWSVVLQKHFENGTPIPDNATNEEWVDVDKRLPEDAYGCLVTVYDTDLKTQDEFENILPYAVGYDGETWNNFCGEPIPFEVVAWTKLPKPYEP